MASTKAEDLAVYDLNGDNTINIIRPAYVNRLTAAEGDSAVLSTAPHGDGQVLAGTVTVEDDQNNRTTHPFDYTPRKTSTPSARARTAAR